jgi:hypothetical protein
MKMLFRPALTTLLLLASCLTLPVRGAQQAVPTRGNAVPPPAAQRTPAQTQNLLPRIVATKGDGSSVKVTLSQGTSCVYEIEETWSPKVPLSKADASLANINSAVAFAGDAEGMRFASESFLNLSAGRKESKVKISIDFQKPQIEASGTRAYLLVPVSLLIAFMNQQGQSSEGVALLNDPTRRLVASGQFRVDSSLDVVAGSADAWSGKKEGAIHTISGALTMFDYEFNSDPNDPLVFRMTSKGYQYLRGKGTVKDLKTASVRKY